MDSCHRVLGCVLRSAAAFGLMPSALVTTATAFSIVWALNATAYYSPRCMSHPLYNYTHCAGGCASGMHVVEQQS